MKNIVSHKYLQLLAEIININIKNDGVEDKILYVSKDLYKFIDSLVDSSLNVKQYVVDVILDEDRPPLSYGFNKHEKTYSTVHDIFNE